jgi:hypothetical protein
VPEYNNQIKEATKRSEYQRDWNRWVKNGYPKFIVRGEVIQKANEW